MKAVGAEVAHGASAGLAAPSPTQRLRPTAQRALAPAPAGRVTWDKPLKLLVLLFLWL